MSDSTVGAPPSSVDDDSKLQHLFSSIMKHRNEEKKQLLNHRKELKNNENMKMASLRVCDAETNFKRIEIQGMEYEQDKGLELWKLCLEAALVKLNIRATTLRVQENVIKLTLEAVNVERVLQLVNPLSQTTQFLMGCYSGTLNAQPFTIEPLHDLIDSVIALQQNETDHFVRDWELMDSWVIDRFETFCFEQDGSRSKIILYFFSDDEVAFWNACFSNALFELKISARTCTKMIERHHIEFNISSDEAKMVLEYLSPIVRRMHVQYLEFTDVEDDIIHLLKTLFKNGRIHYASFNPQMQFTVDFNSWLELIKEISPSIVMYGRKGIPNELNDFLLPLAAFVDAIHILEYDRQEETYQQITISIIKEILERRCSYLDVRGSTIVSIADAEDLVQHFHHLEKKVAVGITTDVESMEQQIGEYCLSTFELLENKLQIEHLNMEPTLLERFWA